MKYSFYWFDQKLFYWLILRERDATYYLLFVSFWISNSIAISNIKNQESIFIYLCTFIGCIAILILIYQVLLIWIQWNRQCWRRTKILTREGKNASSTAHEIIQRWREFETAFLSFPIKSAIIRRSIIVTREETERNSITARGRADRIELSASSC